MATSYLNTKVLSRTEEKRVVTEVKTEVVDAVTLTLTLDEARLIRSMIGSTYGGGRYADLGMGILQALIAVGVGSFGNPYVNERVYVKDVKPLPRPILENLPAPKETREDLCGWVG